MNLSVNKVNFVKTFLFCIIIVSCTSKQHNYNDSQVFRYNEHANITTLDPAFAKDLRTIWVTNQLFNGLVQLDNQLEVLPDIATSWEISADGKRYTFKLRDFVFIVICLNAHNYF